MSFDKAKIEQAVRMILEAVGEDPDREGLRGTPDRVARMYEEIFAGLHKDPSAELSAIFNELHEEVVLVKDIPFYSMCEHHLVPFFGKAHVAYLPSNGRVTGLSKLARLVEAVARKPQLQERITSTIADVLFEKVEALGVIVMVEAEHMCMSMRGVNKPGSRTITTAVRGIYAENKDARQETMALMCQSSLSN
ncbi:GTP cyclohydrolase I FolE [Effusibacillus dendaii]|uniref:GTP cyclohydrolase 1 n=1 Tax=Effusibacillus dendaii TaxID=2743772 RepID=A0A7I8D7H4_9BACL|nr:GTP cyclohydrolase I FolE [Effusibacillus dendaii]BCJ85342.1 GTP cyclohydrolase 1 [Effusibacillus dendaii]